MINDRDVELSKIADLLHDAKRRAQTMQADLLAYIIQCALDEAADIEKGVIELPQKPS